MRVSQCACKAGMVEASFFEEKEGHDDRQRTRLTTSYDGDDNIIIYIKIIWIQKILLNRSVVIIIGS